ncbi:hypothetical protein SAMN04487820_105202 [Actinopolyspora mzabensis]|uniref:Lipoprotein n=1 Tax=Actinopolyspora mzabensis TaxID=995066 RepID=A0A1G8ZYE9_ACTMZ|nr:hypothetical protein [Actinopolyspora mzabensis]SDK19977.1 hypothetical protein SAMN04487820_105202 [Actinopolyspora mzabensis]
MKRLATIGALVLAVAGCSGGPAPNGPDHGGTSTPMVTPSPTTTEQALKPLPAADDLKLSMRVLSKKCYGSAGGLVEYQVDVAYTDVTPISELRPATVTYRATGGEAEQIDSTRLRDGKYGVNRSSVQTPSSSTTLKIEVVDVF